MGSERKTLRCAIYTRKSSEHGLEQDFNSLHAQRESAEAYILSQRQGGWVRCPAALTMAASAARVWTGPPSESCSWK